MVTRFLHRLTGRAAADERVARLEADMKLMRERLHAANASLQMAARRRGVASGVAINSGRFGYERNSAWTGKQRYQTVEAMTNDAHIEGVFRFVEVPLVAAEWDFEPASDKARDKEIAEFVAANLLRKPSERFGSDYWIRTSWQAQRLPEILTMLLYGFALFQRVWKTVDGRHRVFDRLHWLEPRSVDPSGWRLTADGDEIEKIERTYTDPQDRTHSLEPLLPTEVALYPYRLIGARYEGRAYIRALYGAWARKDQFLKDSLTWAQRIGNPVPIAQYHANLPAEQQLQLKTVLEQLRGDPDPELYGLYRYEEENQKVDISYAGSDQGEVDRLRGLIDGENAEIAHGGYTKTMLTGETPNGSRATAQVTATIEKQAVATVARLIAELETHGAGNVRGVVQDLVETNFGKVEMPRLVAKNLDPAERTVNVPGLIDAIAKGAVPKHPKLQLQVIERLGFEITLEELTAAATEERERALREADARAAQARENATSQGSSGSSSGQDEASDPPVTEEGGSSASLASSISFRRIGALLEPAAGARPLSAKGRVPTVLEQRYCSLSTVGETFRVGEAQILGVLKRIHRRAIDEIVSRVENGKINRRTLGSQRGSRFRGMGRAMEEVLAVLHETGMAGARHVADELAAQGAAALAAGDTPENPPKVAGRKIPKEKLAEFADEVRVVAEFDIGKTWSRLMDEAIGEYTRLTRQGLEGDALSQAIDRFLTGLSEAPLEDLARKSSSVAYNQGRDTALSTAASAGVARIAVRTEVLDGNTCESCAALDNLIVEIDTDEYYENMPPAKCAGGERCRGFYIVVGQALEGE